MQLMHKLVLVAALVILGCETKKPATDEKTQAAEKPKNTDKTQPVENTLFRPTASIQEIMLAIIDPNVDPIWNSISTVSTAKGVIERKPQREEEWAELERHAIALREATNLLLIGGRKVAHDGNKTSTHHSELNAPEIEAAIAANRTEFNQLVFKLEEAAATALTAIKNKNVDALEAAGEQIEKSCEGCHSKFWYPGDKRPTQ